MKGYSYKSYNINPKQKKIVLNLTSKQKSLGYVNVLKTPTSSLIVFSSRPLTPEELGLIVLDELKKYYRVERKKEYLVSAIEKVIEQLEKDVVRDLIESSRRRGEE